jgi:hypothetical protein
MSKHQGQTVEKVLRRDGHSISKVARIMNVNRRSIYNWFNQAVLRQEIIYKIGHGILHDFSQEFPELFKPTDFTFKNKSSSSVEEYQDQDSSWRASVESARWREKYMELYPRYKKLLDHVGQREFA